jgi:hypothetical protein
LGLQTLPNPSFPYSPEFRRFAVNRDRRDKISQEKDAVILPLLSAIDIESPSDFHAIIMPCLYGPEAYVLVERGVPAANIFAIERDHLIHREIRECKRTDRFPLAGMSTTQVPMSASSALDRSFVLADEFDLIYLDFFAQPEYKTHYCQTIRKIFELRMLKNNGTLILNFGKARCHKKGIADLNVRLLSQFADSEIAHVPTKILVYAALYETKHPPPVSVSDYLYESHAGRSNKKYVTTVVNFSGE